MLNRADEAVVRSVFGTKTFARGRSYAQRDKVVRCEWESPTRVVGEVWGTAPQPYQASATLERTASGRLSSIDADCTCPVGYWCKHAVALLLADPTPAGSHRRARQVRKVSRPPREREQRPARHAAPPPWERPLAALLSPGAGRAQEGSQVGLQFELAAAGPASPSHRGRSGQRERAGGPGIRLRPVVLSPAGNWVRTGVSWDSIDYSRYRLPDGAATTEAVELLKELLALSRLAAGRQLWAPRQEVVRLESVSSRRVWDLLRQLRDVGAPLLLHAGRAPGAVVLESDAEITLDMRRGESGLRLQASVGAGGSDIRPESSLLIGSPAHGIAWWDGPPADGGPGLRLAPFRRPPTAAEQELVKVGPFVVPERDTARFVREICPRLRRRVAVRSSDGSVDMTELPDVTLMLSVRHHADHRVELAWRRGIPRGWSEELWDGADSCTDPLVEDAIDAATAVATKLRALTEPSPAGERLRAHAQLAGMDAVVFVTHLLPLLEEIDVLEIEQGGTPVDYRAATAAPVVTLGGSGSRDGDWFDLSIDVSVGGEDVPFHELFVALADRRSHLILPSGTYFSLDGPELAELARLIAEARALHDADADAGQVRLSRFQASLWEDFQRLGVLGTQAEEWGASVRALTEASEVAEHPLPATLNATLRPYQLDGFRWLALLHHFRLGGILADDMGLGKTLQALALICHTREQGLAEAPFLVVAPTSVVGNWAAECQRFVPALRVVTVTETTRRRGSTLAAAVAGAHIVVTSYALFRLDYGEFERQEWAGLFLDEAQFAKNSASHAYRRARTLPVPFKVAMTGTPMENNLMELWSLLSISAPGLFPKADPFNEHYRLPIERKGDDEQLAQLRRRVRPFMLRRTKEQVAADLPDRQEQVLELDLNDRHRRLYQTYLQRERQKVLGLLGDMEKNRFAIFRSLTLLRQASLDMSLVDPKHARVPSTKLDTLVPMLEDVVSDGHRVLVFSQFTRFLTLARRRMEAAGIAHCYLDGRTRRRAEVVEDFRQGRAPVFLVSLKAGGFGLNLTEADYCILLDPWWNPATEAQAVDRVHRIGQTRKVMVYRLVARDTIEEKVMALKAKKAALFASVIDGGGFESGALTAEDIRQLLT